MSMARASGEGGANFPMVFWALLLFYAAMAGGAYLFHRSFEVLAGFYLSSRCVAGNFSPWPMPTWTNCAPPCSRTSP